MNNDMIFPILIHAALAFLGGCAREAGNIGKEELNIIRFIIGALVAAFCGIVTFFLCMNYEVSQWLTAALASLAGYAGTPMLDFFTNIIKEKMGSLFK